MPSFSLNDCLRLALCAGYEGIELRVHDHHHVSLNELTREADNIRRRIEGYALQLNVLNSYYGITDTDAVDRLIRVCQRVGAPYFRVTLPVAGNGEVRKLGMNEAVLPSYIQRGKPAEILRNVRIRLQDLARKAKASGVCALIEIHWGTVMSSFTSAHYLTEDLDPTAIGITFDPANMIIEGKEDWEYGIELLRGRMANVHVKNARWIETGEGWKWSWDRLSDGLVDWQQMFCLLDKSGYQGMVAVEDFRVPESFDGALNHLHQLRTETRCLLRQAQSRQAA